MSTVLVVEDSPTQRRMISDLLEANSFNILAAGDGLEALELLQNNRPDVVLLDIVMPHLNGYEVCRRLKGEVPVIFCSSNGTDVNRYWGLKQGAVAYISKPFHAEDLLKTVKHVLRCN